MGGAWNPILDELRCVMTDDGISAGHVDAALSRLGDVFASIESAGGRVTVDLAWAIIGIEGDEALRRLRRRTARRAVDRSGPIRRVAGVR